MKKFSLRLALVAFVSALTVMPVRADPPVPGLKLAFDENFDSLDLAGLDRGAHRWHQVNSHGLRVPRTLIRTQDGILTLTSPPDARWGVNTSISTAPDFPNSGLPTVELFGPGYFETRIRYDPKPKHWPAFWLLAPIGLEHATGRIPKAIEHAWCEIDIIEGLSNTAYGGTVHDWKSGPKPQDIYNRHNNTIRVPQGTDFNTWNVFGVLWTKESISWFFNGVRMSSVPTPEICKIDRLSVVIGAQSLGGPDQHKVDVDWIRVWQ